MEHIAIILVNYNGAEDTINCLRSIDKCDVSKYFDLDIIIVDNHSIRENIEVLESYLKQNHNLKINLIKSEENVGFAAGNNIGLNFLKNKNLFYGYLWYLNNDTLVDTNLISKLYNKLPKKDEVFYFEMRNFQGLFVNNGLNYINLIYGKVSEHYKRSYIPYICGASIFLKCTENVPLWDESFFLYYEDCAYSIELIKKGYKIQELSGGYYFHKINASASKVKKVNLYKIKSQKIFMKKYGKHFNYYCVVRFIYLLYHFRFKEARYFINC